MNPLERHQDDRPVGESVDIVYCFDFDGVLCDTMDESLITSHNAYFGGKARSVSDINPAIRDFFYEHRYLVRPAGEYFLLFHAFERGETVIGKDRFLELKAALVNEMREHADRFYAHRKQMRENLEYWKSLHKLFPQCIDFIEERKSPFFIVTNKDKDSVLTLAMHFGFVDLVIDVYSREISVDKRKLMEKLISDHGLSPSLHHIVYVDDHEGTLGEMEGLPLDLYLASWGYTGKPGSGPFRLLRSLGNLP